MGENGRLEGELFRQISAKGSQVGHFENYLSISKGGSSSKVLAKVSAENVRVASTPKFKRCRVSAVWDFPPGCGRVTTSNFGLTRQIAVDQSSQGKW
ncbi:hypothetical protein J1N35_040965 [Gossypium stocksii]|uniref:Uncharacterized protein n=1 Tax=Gossypium stocksii TaxID=47602 RepID=A0A9D3ZIV3_9ROSI|nr:hypothetical protein J1N35_040965 [Gossypium stocksii]